MGERSVGGYLINDPILLINSIQQSCCMKVNENLEELRNIYNILSNNMQVSQQKIETQKEIYIEIVKTFSKFSTKLANLATKINEEILSTVGNQESVLQSYQFLSNSLLRMAECSRKVAFKNKSEVADPLKTFTDNYERVSLDLLNKISKKMNSISDSDANLMKHREAYNQACQKLEKHREMQNKTISKIENGNVNELQKFNANMKKMTELITSNEKYYLVAVEKCNSQWELIKAELENINQSISYNQESRLAFFKKTVYSSIKTFEEFNHAFDNDVIKKLDESSKAMEKEKYEDNIQKKLRLKIDKLIRSQYKEEFVSYDDLMRSKRKKNNEEENSQLAEIFIKIKEKDKKIMEEMIKPWFSSAHKMSENNLAEEEKQELPMQKAKSMASISIKKEIEKPIDKEKPNEKEKEKEKEKKKIFEKHDRQIDHCREKILSVLPYSYYFIEIIYNRISEMTSFYCKLAEDHFYFLLNAFNVITKNLDLDSAHAEINVQFIFKMMQISQRVMLKKHNFYLQNKSPKSQPIELLSHQYGKNSLKFRQPKILEKILAFIQKRKANKKKNTSENKGVINFTKGFFAAIAGKKGPVLNEDEQYSCLQEMITLISNFSVPNQIILPFIKEALGNNHQSSYQYLKGIIINKKDVEERLSLFYKKEIKEKKEDRFKRAYENKRMPEYCIAIVAKHGFFSKHQLNLRLVGRSLKNLHFNILARLPLTTEQKWIHLIPNDPNLHYVSMKQEVAENSFPSAVEEIITLDVNRSLHMHGECLNPTILHSLLRTYAFFHKEISYCQGMNYIAGYIYIKTKNQEYTYRIFEHLMEIRFKEIFLNQFEILKLKMYQFERLLAIFHPEISDHFKRQAISPECYIVSWIITLFASSYQYTMESYVIDFLWERFIIWGWREFYKFVLWLFSLFKEDLIQLTYDRALHFLGEIGRSKMFLASYKVYKQDFSHIEDLNQGLERYSVTAELLEKFSQEYTLDKQEKNTK